MIRTIAACLLATALSAVSAMAQDNTRCDANAYALCSHALCTCLDASGAPTDCPTDGSAEAGTVWSSCECPVVSVSGSPEYNANIGNTSCQQRLATTLPGFATPLALDSDVELIFSQYSLGDAMRDDSFGTLNAAQMQQCASTGSDGSQAYFANCLDQPCFWDGTSGTAACYCPVNPATETWNTFTETCGETLCDTQADQVWSAAGVSVTQSATGYLQGFIAAMGRTPPSVTYCAPG